MKVAYEVSGEALEIPLPSISANSKTCPEASDPEFSSLTIELQTTNPDQNALAPTIAGDFSSKTVRLQLPKDPAFEN